MAIPLIPIAVGAGLYLLTRGKRQKAPTGSVGHDLPESPGNQPEDSDVTANDIIGGVVPVVVAVVPVVVKAVLGAGVTTTAVTGTVVAVAPAAGGAASGAAAGAATTKAVAVAAQLSTAAVGGIVFAVIVVVIVATIIIGFTAVGYDAWKNGFAASWTAADQAQFVDECLYGQQVYSLGVWQYVDDKRGLIPEIRAITDEYCTLEVVARPEINYSNKFLTKGIVFEAL